MYWLVSLSKDTCIFFVKQFDNEELFRSVVVAIKNKLGAFVSISINVS